MSVHPPEVPVATSATASEPRTASRSPATDWLLDNALFQPINGTMWGSLIVGWVAVGSSLAAATAAALALCLAVPFLGWFFGLPIVFGLGMVAAACWFGGLLMLFGAWACTAASVAAITFASRLLNARSSS